ncbi:HWE histidine kinase domain-containing protein [Microvirga yunnanensis]|uniref:HWE histidine kinase domain-containing protein n=1 Tax=Microvirga yunnanensis TaxID=2953740 RepID=UPI0021C74F10|nr:HWE histidine kinase domain-containing protein [Microvirga sp. HBU65207]
MNHEPREAAPGRSPEQGGTSADELAYRLHQQELLAGFGGLALRTPDFLDLLQEATRLCAQGLHVRYCKAMEYLPDENRLIVRAGVGWKPGTIGSMTGADPESPTGYAFRTGEPVISSHLGDGDRFRTPRILAEHGIRRAINVPIATEASRYGILEADSPAEGRFTGADLAFLRGFANLLGVALERQGGEERLRLAHARNEEILESISDAFYAVDRDWRFTYVNRRAEEWWGRKREDLIGKVYWDEFPQAVGSEAYEAHQLARRERRTVHVETVSPLGHWVDIDIHPTAGGGLSVYFRDATERKRGELALRQTEERYRLAAKATNDAVWDWDLVADRILWNEALTALFGYTDLETMGAWWKDHIHPDDREHTVEDFHAVIAGDREHWSAEYRFLRADGSEAYVFDRGFVIRDGSGKAVRMIGAMLDITETKQAEEHQRLLINELNHRVKNTLATVQSIASQTLRNATTLNEAQAAFEARLFALSRAHDVLTRENWEGASLRAIVTEAVPPFSNDREDRLHLRGADVRLSPRMALALAMALQELSTNAVKYGALSNATGEIRIQWMLDHAQVPPHLHLRWEENGGPPVQAPKRRGFGTRLIERSLAMDLNGDVEIRFAPSGVVCTVDAPLESIGSPSPGHAGG